MTRQERLLQMIEKELSTQNNGLYEFRNLQVIANIDYSEEKEENAQNLPYLFGGIVLYGPQAKQFTCGIPRDLNDDTAGALVTDAMQHLKMSFRFGPGKEE